MIKKIIFILLFGLKSLAQDETIIEDKVDFKENLNTYVKSQSDDKMAQEASVLENVPGMIVSINGGPMANTAVTYRGLSPQRLRFDLEGLKLNDPIFGMADGNSLFLFATQNISAYGNNIFLKLPNFTESKAKASLSFGSNQIIKMNLISGTPLSKDSDIMVATQIAQSKNDFSFYSPDLDKNDPQNNFSRKNNDQRRASFLGRYQKDSPNLKLHSLLALNFHEGGIPGFALSPTNNLRNNNIFFGARFGIAKKTKNTEISFSIANSLFNHKSEDDLENYKNLLSSSHEIIYGFKPLTMPLNMEVDFAQKIVIEKDYSNNKQRLGFGLVMNREMRFKGRIKPMMLGSLTIMAMGEDGLLLESDNSFSVEPLEYWNLIIRLAKTSRLPTFMELFSKNQFFMGNPNLKKEGIWDIELISKIFLRGLGQISLTGYYGFLSNNIIFVPYHAHMLRPVNADYARRMGLDLGLSISPLSLVSIDAKTSLLKTFVKNTKAPLPQTPSLSGLIKVRLGDENFISVTLQNRFRTATTTDMSGTLRSKGYALLDILASWQIHPLVGASLSLSNILNQKHLQDSYQMPIPGFSLYGQIELGRL